MRKALEIEMAQKIIDQMETAGTAWIKPWASRAASKDHSVNSKRPYRGINVFLLGSAAAANGWTSNVWGTYKAWKTKGNPVAKGQRGTHIVFWKRMEGKSKTETDDNGDPKKFQFLLAREYTVFNSEQLTEPYIEGAEDVDVVTDVTAECPLAEEAVGLSGAVIEHGSDKACYIPSLDMIKMPDRGAFMTPTGYWQTLLHELTHWTGHKSRNARDFSGMFGNDSYAFEELIAEMGSALLCGHLGVEVREIDDQHAKYLNSWVRQLKDKPKSVWTAFSKAQAAVDLVMGPLEGSEESDQEEAA